VEEILPGVLHWTAFHEGIGSTVHSCYVRPAEALVDPMLPDAGLEALEGESPRRILLTNRHHYRHSDHFREAFDCPVLCHEAGLHEFDDGPDVEGFSFGDEVAPGIFACEVGVICPEETALHLTDGDGAMAFADAIVNYGEIGFVPDNLLGDDPEEIRRGLKEALKRLAENHDFEALLFAHGEPITTGGRQALRDFATRG
jgi:glyoxylase-like metal-dependent hydrolase (beta-lactamase superfamily II)